MIYARGRYSRFSSRRISGATSRLRDSFMKFLIKPNARGGYRGPLLLTLYLISRVVDEKIKRHRLSYSSPPTLFQFATEPLQCVGSGIRGEITGVRQNFFFTTGKTVSRAQSRSWRAFARSKRTHAMLTDRAEFDWIVYSRVLRQKHTPAIASMTAITEITLGAKT